MKKKLNNPKSYPKADGKHSSGIDRFLYVKYPVKCNGGYYCADVMRKGHSAKSIIDNVFEKESDCQHACDVHNKWAGFSKEYVNAILTWSMFGNFVEPVSNTEILENKPSLPEINVAVNAECQRANGEIEFHKIRRIKSSETQEGWQWSHAEIDTFFTLKVLSWQFINQSKK